MLKVFNINYYEQNNLTLKLIKFKLVAYIIAHVRV